MSLHTYKKRRNRSGERKRLRKKKTAGDGLQINAVSGALVKVLQRK